MRSALKLSALLLCLSPALGNGPLTEPAGAERTLVAGCPATAIVCPDPRPTADEKPVSEKKKKGQKGGKG
jgi:hypothetical protein